MFLNDVEELEEESVLEVLGAALVARGIRETATDVLDSLRERTGLLAGPGVYSFSHKSIAEYLVAEVLVEGTTRDSAGERIDRMRLFRHKNDDRWNGVLFLWAGLSPSIDFEDFIFALMTARDDARSWELIFGLLDDQFERTSEELWDECVREFAKLDFGRNRKCQFLPRMVPVRTSSAGPAVRSLSETSGSVVFPIGRACDAGYLGWLSSAQTNNTALRWVMATRHPQDEKWIERLSRPESELDLHSWPIVAACWSLHALLEAPTQVFEKRLAELSVIWPDFRCGFGYEVIANIARGDFDSVGLAFLSELCTDEVPASWTGRLFIQGEVFLLAHKHIADAVTLGSLPDNDQTQQALANLERLELRRIDGVGRLPRNVLDAR